MTERTRRLWIGLRFALPAYGTRQDPPREFRLFAFGRNETTKGTFWLSPGGARKCIAAWQARQIDLSIDYEHAAVDPPATGAPAAGWFDLEIRPDGLWAVNVRWTERARSYLQAGEYRYFSPYFNVKRDKQGREWIVEIFNCALTNMPATNRQRPLVARALRRAGARLLAQENAMLNEKQIEALKGILKEIGVPDEKLSDGVLKLMPFFYEEEKVPEELPAEEPEEMGDPMEDVEELRASLARQSGEIKKIRLERDTLKEALSALKDEVKAMREERAAEEKAKREAVFTRNEAAGRHRFLNRKDPKKARTLFEKDYETYLSLVEDVDPLENVDAPPAPKGLTRSEEKSGTEPTKDDADIARQLGLDPRKLAETRATRTAR